MDQAESYVERSSHMRSLSMSPVNDNIRRRHSQVEYGKQVEKVIKLEKLSPEEIGLIYLFERLSSPLFIPKANHNVIYDLPQTLKPKGISEEPSHPGATHIKIDLVPSFENIPESVTAIPRGTIFSHFIPSHRQAAKELTDYLMNLKGVRSLLNYAANIRDYINETLFVYCLSLVLLRKPEYNRVTLPSIVEVMPYKFIPQMTLLEAEDVAKSYVRANNEQGSVVVLANADFSGSNLNLEHRVAYWREDYGLNSHHWHWHLIHPSSMGIYRDRKGEAFYYNHHQMMARYDMERLSNNMSRVLPFNNLSEPLLEGYYPKLTIHNSKMNWGTRQDNTRLSDYRRHEWVDQFTLKTLMTWNQRLLEGIEQERFIDINGRVIRLSDDVAIEHGEKRGIDIIGDVFEADADLSVNYPYYGDLHNFGHLAIAAAHDPDGQHKEALGVLSESATALRDPAFFRWHRFTDNVFQMYKLKQRPYTIDELVVKGVDVTNLIVKSGAERQLIKTFFDTKQIEASKGLDFKSQTSVNIAVRRLNHEPFQYNILVRNTNKHNLEVTVRIFLAPKYDEYGYQLKFMDQRILWAEMDKFQYKLQKGSNNIIRHSNESSITNDEEVTFGKIKGKGRDSPSVSQAFCNCGWPQHLLVPKGNENGMHFELFVILSDYKLDKVSARPISTNKCNKAVSYCGLLEDKFPDRRPMGYPFDRRVTSYSMFITDYVNVIPNSIVGDIIIQFLGVYK